MATKTLQEWSKLAQDKVYCRSLGIAFDNSYRNMTEADAVRMYNHVGLPWQGVERQMLIETILEAKA